MPIAISVTDSSAPLKAFVDAAIESMA